MKFKKAVTTRRLFFSALLMTFVAVVLGPEFVGKWVRQYSSASWPTADAHVLECRTRRATAKMFTRNLDVRYKYAVDSVEYESIRYQFGPWATGSWSVQTVSGIAASMPVGSRIRVAYDPGDPASATVRTGVTVTETVATAFVAVLFPMVVIGLWIELAKRLLRKPNPTPGTR